GSYAVPLHAGIPGIIECHCHCKRRVLTRFDADKLKWRRYHLRHHHSLIRLFLCNSELTICFARDFDRISASIALSQKRCDHRVRIDETSIEPGQTSLEFRQRVLSLGVAYHRNEW